MSGSHYMIDETEYAYCKETNKKDKLKTSVIDVFKHNCSNKNIKNVFCQVDKDSFGKASEGITTYGIETKDTDMLTITVYENNYEACKEEMMILGNAVKNAESRMKRKNQIRLRLAGATILVVGSIAALGSCSLQKGKNKEQVTTETSQEIEMPSVRENSAQKYEIEKEQAREEEREKQRLADEYSTYNYNQLMDQYRDMNTMDNVIPIDQYYEEQGIENPNQKTMN